MIRMPRNLKSWKGLRVDRALKGEWLLRMNSLKGTPCASSCAGHAEATGIGRRPHVAVLVQRPNGQFYEYLNAFTRIAELSFMWNHHHKHPVLILRKKRRFRSDGWWWNEILTYLEQLFGTIRPPRGRLREIQW